MLGCGIHDCTQKSCQLHPWLHCQLMFVLPSLCLAFGVAVIESVFLVISAHICQDTHLINLITHIRSDHSIIGSIVGTLFNPMPMDGQGSCLSHPLSGATMTFSWCSTAASAAAVGGERGPTHSLASHWGLIPTGTLLVHRSL
jgi:hypothetical protein